LSAKAWPSLGGGGVQAGADASPAQISGGLINNYLAGRTVSGLVVRQIAD
jgi:hypothetical protein